MPQACANRTAITSLTREPKALRIRWADGHESVFHYIWLRDCCYCATCGDSYSSKRYLVPHEIPPASSPNAVELSPEGGVTILWDPDNHRSHYAAAWLRRHCYSDAARAQRRHHPRPWDAAAAASLPPVHYEAVRDSDSARLDLLRRLRDHGFALLLDGPQTADGITQIAGLVGTLEQATYDQVFDIRPESAPQLMGNLNRAVPPHNDEPFRFTPPGIATLQCLTPADEGGESLLVDGFHVAALLRAQDPEAFDLLARIPQGYHRFHEGQVDLRVRSRVIRLDEEGEVIGFRFHTRSLAPLDVPGELVEPLYAANQALCRLLSDPANQFRRRLAPGEALLFDNHRVLHAREAFGGNRHMRLCNVSREEFHQTLRLLARRLGHREEADARLAAGATG